MTAITSTGTATPTIERAAHRHPVRRAALISGAIAAVAPTAIAAVAHAAGVPLAVDGEMIPLAGFAQMTLLGAVLGGLILVAMNRYSTQPRRRFLRVATALTVLSCVPSLALPPDVATKITLVATHVIAAVMILPALAAQTRR